MSGYATSPQPGIEQLLARVRAQMELDSETEQEVMAEIRDHLEEALAEAQAGGLDEEQALALVADRFGAEEQIGRELQVAHAGWGTADAVIAAGLPVVCALILRWLAFAPDGTSLGWPQLLSRPAFWIVALAALFIPLLKLDRWHYALVAWVIFWGLTMIFVTFPAMHW